MDLKKRKENLILEWAHSNILAKNENLKHAYVCISVLNCFFECARKEISV